MVRLGLLERFASAHRPVIWVTKLQGIKDETPTSTCVQAYLRRPLTTTAFLSLLGVSTSQSERNAAICDTNMVAPNTIFWLFAHCYLEKSGARTFRSISLRNLERLVWLWLKNQHQNYLMFALYI